jgi:hypothetical protein
MYRVTFVHVILPYALVLDERNLRLLFLLLQVFDPASC